MKSSSSTEPAKPPISDASATAPRPAVGWPARLLLSLSATLLPLLLLEVALRLFGPFLPGNYDTGAYLVRNEELGHFHLPNFDGWIKAPEFTTHVQINALGLRDRRQSYAKPAGTFRIVLLGDSFVEAVQVEQWQGIAERLERSLNHDASRPIEVVNAGVAAYGTGQEYLLLDRLGPELQPDLVILLFFVGNDLTNNNYRLELWDSNLTLALKPYFDLRSDGTLQFIPGPPPQPQTGLSQMMRNCCLLYNVIETGVFNKLGRNYPREQLEAIGGLRSPLTGLYDAEPDEEWTRAWRISEALLARTRDRAASLGAPLIVAAAPEWRALDPDAWRAEIQRGNPRSNRLASGRLQIDVPTNRVGAIAGQLGVPFINLLPAFQAASTGSAPLYFSFDKHWTAAGHAVAAQAIHQALYERETAEGISPPPPDDVATAPERLGD